MTAADSGNSAPEVLLGTSDGVGRITLNRPRAINALNHGIVKAISAALDRWAEDDTIHTVVVDGAGERGLCAGGDIRAIHRDAVTGGEDSLDFWFDEYRMNRRIADFPKPVVAVMDGLVMGGGVGISAHASHRVVTDRTVLGMPEVKIGLVPDVGGTYLLARAPGTTGLRMALTGASVTGADAIALGLADRLVAHDQLPALLARIGPMGADGALAATPTVALPDDLTPQRSWSDECYAAATAEEILDRLRGVPADAARADAEAIEKASPTSVKLALRAIRSAASLSLPEALNQEYRLVSALLRSADLIEGIRAQVIDKDRNPRWTPDRLDAVTGSILDRYFLPTPRLPFASAGAASPANGAEQ